MSTSLPIHKRGLFGVLTLAVVAILATLLCSSPGTARAVTRTHKAHPGKPTIVLVHGAWADASSWSRVITRLQSDGYTVDAPPDPLRGIASDSASLASFLKTIPGPVVLVGHSYGGAVITNAATSDPEVKALVYVDAFIPNVGENCFQILGGSGSAFDIPDPSAVFDIVGYPGAPEGDAEAFLKPSTVHEAFAPDLSEADRWLIAASQRPITLGANTAPTETAAWKTIPSWVVVGTEDRVIPPATQRRMAERAGSTITEVAGSHVSMVSHPAAAIDAILAAVAAIGD